jgi:hypothetical protein
MVQAANMKRLRRYLAFVVTISIVSFIFGCATLPNVKEVASNHPETGKPLQASKPLTIDQWKKRPSNLRIKEWFAHLLKRFL